VIVPEDGHLGEVGDAEDLAAPRELPELLAEHFPVPSSHADVHFVEDHRGHRVGPGQRQLFDNRPAQQPG